MVLDGSRDGNLGMPNGVRLTSDESLLVVADTVGRTAWSFHIEPGGWLIDGQPFYHLQLPTT